MSTPRISVNKLAEYVQNTNAVRRRQIVTDAKIQRKYIVTRYREAREFITRFIMEGQEPSILAKGIEVVRKKPSNSEFQENDQILSLFALELMADVELPDLSGFKIEPFDGDNALLEIKGVEVKVNPDLLLITEQKGKIIYGGVKIHISKNFRLAEDGQKTVATVLRQYLESRKLEGEVSYNHCYSVDVFEQRCVSAPAAFKQRMKQVEVACQEIALWWSTITDPTASESESK